MTRRTLLALAAANFSTAARFSKSLGLQLYSLRREAARDLSRTFALVRELGFTELEVGDFFNRTASEFQRMLSANGLKATSMGAGCGELTKSVNQAADDAHALGVEYVTCSQIPRKKQLTLDNATRAAEDLNRWGESLASSGLRLCYHIHGY